MVNLACLVLCTLLVAAQVPSTVPSTPPPSATPSLTTVEADGALLWRNLRSGQSASEVLAAIVKYPEVRSAALKPGKNGGAPDVRLTMNKGGIPIYGSEFTLDPTFSSNGLLSDVLLISRSECASSATAKYEKIASALKEKYGEEITERTPLRQVDVSSALYESYEAEKHRTITYGFANKDVAVALILAFSHSKPPEYVGAGGFAHALYSLSKSIYDTQRQKCDNSGDRQVVYALRYLGRSDFDATISAAAKARSAEDRQADDNL